MPWIIQIVLSIVLTLASQLIQQALAPKPKPVGIKGQLQIGGTSALSFIVGTFATAGKLEYANTWGTANGTPNAYLTQVISLSDLPCNAMTGLYVIGEEMTIPTTGHVTQGYPVPEYALNGQNYLWREFFSGSQTTVNTFLTSKFGADADRPWLSDMIGRGLAYVTLTSRFNRDLWTGIPTYVVEVQGLKLYDPRLDSAAGGTGTQRWATPSTWTFSDNPVVIIYNILRGISYAGEWVWGMQDDIDDSRLPYATWAAAMNACDALISLDAGGTEKRFRAGREISVNENPIDVINELLIGCTGRMTESAGVYSILIGATPSAAASFTDADVVVTEGATLDPFPALDDIINGATATYLEPTQAWEAKETAPYYNATYEAADDGRRQLAGLSLHTTFSGTQAQRILQATVRDARNFAKHVVPLGPSYSARSVLEVLSWTSTANGYVTKDFLITSKAIGPNGITVFGLQEVDPTDHDWVPGTDETALSFTPVTPIRPGTQLMTGWTATATSRFDENGNAWMPTANIAYAGSLEDVRAVRIQARQGWSTKRRIFDGQVAYDPDEAAPSSVIDAQFEAKKIYEFRGRFLPFSGRTTRWSNQDEDGTEGPWISVTMGNIAPVPPSSITNAELNAPLKAAVNFVNGTGPGTLQALISEITGNHQGVAGDLVGSVHALSGDINGIFEVADGTRASFADFVAANLDLYETHIDAVTHKPVLTLDGNGRPIIKQGIAATVQTASTNILKNLATGQFAVHITSTKVDANHVINHIEMSMLASLTANGTYIDTGFLIVLDKDAAGKVTSSITAKADKMYWTDGKTSTRPMEFINGELTLTVAAVKRLKSGLITSNDAPALAGPGSRYIYLSPGDGHAAGDFQL